MWRNSRSSQTRTAARRPPPALIKPRSQAASRRRDDHRRRLAILAGRVAVIRRTRHVDVRSAIARLAARTAPAAVIVALIDRRLLIVIGARRVAVSRSAVIRGLLIIARCIVMALVMVAP